MSTSFFGTPPAISTSIAPRHRGRRAGSLGIVAGAAIALFIGGMGASASAAPGQSTIASANVLSGITMTNLVAAVALTGTPGATVLSAAPVTYNVETNNTAGYTVTVEPVAAFMLPTDRIANIDTIPIAALTIREAATGPYTALAVGTQVPVHSQGGRSVDLGDNLSTNFQMRIPTVNADTYTATLNYVATTL